MENEKYPDFVFAGINDAERKVDVEVFEMEELIGTVENIYDLGKQMVLALNKDGREVLIPLQDGMAEVNKTKKCIYVNLPEGLVDLYLE